MNNKEADDQVDAKLSNSLLQNILTDSHVTFAGPDFERVEKREDKAKRK